MFGRRDRCLLVLAELAGVPYKHIASLTAGDVAFDDGTVVITADGATYRLTPAEDPVLCPACAVARWLEVLDVAVRQIATVAIAEHLRKARHRHPDSPHACRAWTGIDDRPRPCRCCPDRPMGIVPVSPHAGCPPTRSPARPAT